MNKDIYTSGRIAKVISYNFIITKVISYNKGPIHYLLYYDLSNSYTNFGSL